ncbi:MAG: polysaccharide biosynthesis/export family protein [Pseudomonadota bacterium]
MWKPILVLVVLLWSLPGLANNYKIQPGDTLVLEVLEDETMRRSVLVLPDGSVSLPLAGTVPVAGLTVPQVEALIRGRIGPNYVSLPTIHISVTRLAEPRRVTTTRARGVGVRSSRIAGISVFAMGELGKPGKLVVPRGTTMMQLLAEAGGFTRFAASSRVLLRRVDARTKKIKSYRINARSMMNGGTQMVVLQQGDVIVVPERKLFE